MTINQQHLLGTSVAQRCPICQWQNLHRQGSSITPVTLDRARGERGTGIVTQTGDLESPCSVNPFGTAMSLGGGRGTMLCGVLGKMAKNSLGVHCVED
eukprot:1932325-Ditylum_brightwellii.AAC.1